MKIRVAIVAAGMWMGASALAIPATDLALTFKEDRTEANRMYRNKEVSVDGNFTTRRREAGSKERVILDDSVALMLDRKDETAQAIIADLEKAEKQDEDRADRAREWMHHYKRRYRQYGGRYRGRKMETYSDEINPYGATKESLKLAFTATGTCIGVRGGHVVIDDVSIVGSIPMLAPQAAIDKQKQNQSAQAAAMEMTSWSLDGTVFCENGQRYFAPDPDQHGVDVWSITLPARVGDVAIIPAVNNKRGTLEFDCKPMKRHSRGILPSHVKLKSLKLD